MGTLSALDWYTGDKLGRFYWGLVMQFGSIERAADTLELKGQRRLGVDEFVKSLCERKLAEKEDAAVLARMLSANGVGHKITGVSRQELLWLEAMAPYLPHPAATCRVSPGTLASAVPVLSGEPSDHTLTSGASTTASGLDLSLESGAALSNEAAGSPVAPEIQTDDDDLQSRKAYSIHDKLYSDGSLRKEKLQQLRKKVIKERAPVKERPKDVEGTNHPKIEPRDKDELFEQLHEDHKLRLERRQKKIDAYNVDRQKMLEDSQLFKGRAARISKDENHHPVAYSDQETYDRLRQMPKRYDIWEERGHTRRLKQGHTINGKKFDRTEEEIYGKKKDIPVNDSHRTIQLYEKTIDGREEKKRLEAQRHELEEAAEAKKKVRNCNMHHLQKLYEDHAVQQQKKHEIREKVRGEEEEAMLALGGPPKSPSPTQFETFDRLYYDRFHRDNQLNEKRLQLEYEQEHQMKERSVHRKAIEERRSLPEWCNRPSPSPSPSSPTFPKTGNGTKGGTKGQRVGFDTPLRPSYGNNMPAITQSTKQALTEEIFETLGIPLEPEHLKESHTEPGLRSRLQDLRTPAKAASPAYQSARVLDAVAGLPVKNGGRAGGMNIPGAAQSRLALQA